MGKKIIVAGGGHGGIATGMILAKKGYDVTVYEKNSEKNMGHDWTDIFDRKGFTAIGIPVPPERMYNLKHDMTFYGPSLTTPITQSVPYDELEIQMERSDIYKYIIHYAKKAGVKFVFDCEVKGPILLGNRIVGIKTSMGNKFADLVIDACGIHSPVRRNLPSSLGIQKDVEQYEQFYVYRAFFNKTCEVEDVNKFKVVILAQGKHGLSWVATEEEWTDVLIGRLEPFDIEEANATIEKLRETNPSLGTERLRGGQFVNIPVRQPLGVMVADGYVAIGDSAFMTVPVIGSGIANSFKAARILALTILKDKEGSYSAETLWNYQRRFFKELGNGLAPLASIKMMLARFDAEDLDYVFDNKILNADDMTIGADSNSLVSMMKVADATVIPTKLTALAKNRKVRLKVLRMGKDLASAVAITTVMPKKYNRKAILKWVKTYNDCFKF